MAPSHTTAEGGIAQPHRELVTLMKQDAAKTECLMDAVASFLEERIALNDQAVLPPGCVFVSNISVRGFFDRIIKYSSASPCNYVIGLIYLQRLKQSGGKSGENCKPFLTTETYQRLVLTAVMLASKFLDDYYNSNKHWAQIGGISVRELNALEADMLQNLGWDLAIQREEYDWFARELFERAENLEEAQHAATAHDPEPYTNQDNSGQCICTPASGNDYDALSTATASSSSNSSNAEDDSFRSASSTPPATSSSQQIYDPNCQWLSKAVAHTEPFRKSCEYPLNVCPVPSHVSTDSDGWTERNSLVL